PAEFLYLEVVQGLRWWVTPFPVDLPVVEHGAELVDGTVEEGLLLFGQRRRRVGEQLRPIRISGEEVGVPPDVARLQRFALGIGHRRQHAPRPGEDRLGDGGAAKAHGHPLEVRTCAMLLLRMIRYQLFRIMRCSLDAYPTGKREGKGDT